MLMDKERCTLLVVDIQDKLLPAVADADGLLKRAQWLISAARDLSVPIIFSEQYPRGLGHTLPELLDAAPGSAVAEKQHFSCVDGGCLPQDAMAREQVIVCGMEAHVCVLQTVLQLLEQGKKVFVVADAVSSRKPSDVELALERMRAAGAVIVNREMALFEWLRSSAHSQFKDISKRYLQGEQP